MDYGNLCEDILNLDPKMRFAGVCDDTGEIKYGGQREGVKNLLMPEETKKSNIHFQIIFYVNNSSNNCSRY